MADELFRQLTPEASVMPTAPQQVDPYGDDLSGAKDAAADILSLDSFIGGAGRFVEQQGFAPDEDFQYSEDLWKELTDGLDDDWKEMLVGAYSEPHARLLANQAREQQERLKRVESLGTPGLVARLAVGFLDPAALAMDAAAIAVTGGLSGGISAGNRISRALKLGTAIGASVGAQTAIQGQSNPAEIDAETILYATMIGGGLGAGIGALSSGGLSKTPEMRAGKMKVAEAIEARTAARAGHELTEAGKAVMNARPAVQSAEAGENALVEAASPTKLGVGGPEEGAIDVASDSVGAMRAQGFEPRPGEGTTIAERRVQAISESDEPLLERSALAGAEWTITSFLKGSDNPIVRALGNLIPEESVGNKSGRKTLFSVTENVNQDIRVRDAEFYQVAKPAFNAWRKSSNFSWWRETEAAEAFFEEVGQAVRLAPGEYQSVKSLRNADPETITAATAEVHKAADLMRTQFKDMLQWAKDQGLRGFQEVAENERYFPRIYSANKLQDILEKFGHHELNRLIRVAIQRNSAETIEDADLDMIARAYVRRITSARYDVTHATILNADRRDDLAQLVREELAGEIDDVDGAINRIFAQIDVGPDATEGMLPRARRRLGMDEDTEIQAFDRHSREYTNLRLDDLFENNAETIWHKYSRQITGAGYMHNAMKHFDVEGAGTPTFEALLNNARQIANHYGLDPGRTKREMDTLELLKKVVFAQPVSAETRFTPMFQVLRDMNFMRVMGQVGFAQIAELGNSVGTLGVRAFSQGIPAFGAMLRRGKNGQWSDELLAELDGTTAFMSERLRRPMTVRYDNIGAIEGGVSNALRRGLRRGTNAIADVSFMAPINHVLRGMTYSGMANRWANLARNGEALGERRLASLGLDLADAEAISEQIRKYGTNHSGDSIMAGGRVRQLGLENWDPELRAMFEMHTDRWMRHIIQENDIGQLSMWMTTELGKTAIQFRTFAIGAWTKQFLHGIHVRDTNVAGAWIASMMFASLSYSVQTYLRSLGRDDAQEYRERRLSFAEIGKAGFQRAGFASLMPGALDTLTSPLGLDPMFQFGRTTSLDTNLISGIPTVDLLFNKIPKATHGIAASALRSDYDFSQDDGYALKGALIGQNILGVENLLNNMISRLPENSE